LYEQAQMNPRRFVGTMLVPHRRENAELGECRSAADESENAFIFVRLQAMRGNEIGGDVGFRNRGHKNSGSRGHAVSLVH
jgi:hypothetical protein